MKNAKRFAASLLAGAMAFTMLTPQTALAAKKKKASYTTRAYALEQIEKKLGATVQADDETMSAVTDVKAGTKNYKVVSVAINAGLITPNAKGKVSPKTKVTKKYVADALAKVTEGKSASKSSKKLTKSSLKAFLNKQIPTVVSKSNVKIKKGTVIINKPITLKNKTIKGDLIIADGVAAGSVVLDNVKVTGKIIFRAGNNTVSGTTSAKSVSVRQINDAVGVNVADTASLDTVTVLEGSKNVTVSGTVKNLTIDAADSKVALSSARIDSLTIADTATNASVTADKGTTVDTATLDATGTSISGEGKITAASVNANGTTVATPDTKITTKEGVTAPKTSTETTPEKPATPAAGGTTGGFTGGTGNNNSSPSGGNNNNNNNTNQQSGNKDEHKVTYTTDARFAEGYPKIETVDSTDSSGTYKKAKLIYKLADNVDVSTGSAVRVYYVYTPYDDTATNSAAVIHGHLGGKVTDPDSYYYGYEDYVDSVSSDQYGFVDITDKNELSVDLEYYNSSYIINAYSVIDDGKKISEVPTKTTATVGEAPKDSNERHFYIYVSMLNAARDKIYVYTYDEIDPDSVKNTDDFKLKLNGYEPVDDIDITGVTVKNFDKRMGCIILTLGKPLPISENRRSNDPDRYRNSIFDWSGYDLEYRPTEGNYIKNKDGITMGYRSMNLNTISSEPVALKSSDNKYLNVIFPACAAQSGSYDFGLKINGVKNDSVKPGFTMDYVCYFVENGSDADINSIELIKNFAGDVKDAAGDTVSENSLKVDNINVISDDFKIDSAMYQSSGEKENGTLTLKISGADNLRESSLYGCSFELKVGNKEYRLTGYTSVDRESDYNEDEQKFVYEYYINFDSKQIAHIDFDASDSIQIRYAPLNDEVKISQLPGIRYGYRLIYNQLHYNSYQPVLATDWVDVIKTQTVKES